MRRRAITILMAALAIASGCAPESSTRPAAKSGRTDVDYARVAADVEGMLGRIRTHGSALAAMGPRQTGQTGCDSALDYIRRQLDEAAEQAGTEVREFSSPVTVPLDRPGLAELDNADEPYSHLIVEGLTAAPQRWPAYALMPNCVQPCATHPPEACPLKAGDGAAGDCPNCQRPRRLVDLASGRWEEFRGKDLDDAVVLLDFDSGDAWLRAASLGAYGAVLVEPTETTVFQADAKYLATLPLHFPRMYVRRSDGLRLREALAAGEAGLRVTIVNRLRLANATARGLELTIPGKRRDYCFVLTAHFDARCIVPDMAFGGAEVWGVAELLELTRHFAANPPDCDLRILLVSGHWQGQRAMRDYVAYGGPAFDQAGNYLRVIMGVDLVPGGRSVNLIDESAWDYEVGRAYRWLRDPLFAKGGWRDQVLDGLKLDGTGAEIFAGPRPVEARTDDAHMAPRDDRCPLVYAPRYPTAEEPWQVLMATTFAFQTAHLARLAHNTPLDRWSWPHEPPADDGLRRQMQITLALLGHLMQYPIELIPEGQAELRKQGNYWGRYARLQGHIQQWDRTTGWFSKSLPRDEIGRPLRTFVQAYPLDAIARQRIGPRLRNYLQWPLAPGRGRHRELQSFMFQDLRLLERPDFVVNTIYTAFPDTAYNVVAYTLDEAGRIRFAADYGVHGDSNKSFQCTDLPIDSWSVRAPVTLFECGAMELFDLVDPQRYNPYWTVRGSWLAASRDSYRGSGIADYGLTPHLKVAAVKDVASHTDLSSWGFTQYGPTAMVFLPSSAAAAEVILGRRSGSFAVLNNPDAQGRPQGYRFEPGEALRLASSQRPTALACLEQLAALDERRERQFAAHDVASPQARKYRQESRQALEAGREAQHRRDWQVALAQYNRAWVFESAAYRETVSLLLDVVSTTVLYFVLLIPFSFLMERLVLPQRTIARSAGVATGIFAAFAAVLYLFHPGFRLAHNVLVTVMAFVIVVMTIPALVMLLVRGVAMLRAIGSKAVISQRSEAESAGVLIASLSLAVSNMRRRRLRTALTLTTITTLVVALVLLTTSSAYDFRILAPAETEGASFEGIQIYNAMDRRQPLLTETVELYEAALRDEALLVRRECVNYGYDPTNFNGMLYLRARGRRVAAPYLQVMDYRDDLIEYARIVRDGPGRDDRKEVTRLSDLFGGKDRFLAPGDVDVCLLPNTMAEALGVGVGDTVTLMGLPLTVKGVWTAQSETGTGPLDALMDLDGKPPTAMRGAAWQDGEMDNPLHAPSREIAIVPREWVRRKAIFPSCVYSLIVIPTGDAGPEAVVATAGRLAREILNVDVFTHSIVPDERRPGGLVSRAQRISMHAATRVKGSSLMLVVLAAAVLMILAIMTGTVYERMREIHIFSSVGLSPRHVAGMFLVEALVYAGIASVLGYFVGIVALKALLAHLRATGQQQEFYPNYLGVFVLYSIGVAVAATVASSLYPIRLASRIVNPSAGRTWKLQEVSGGVGRWRVRLPFIATTWEEARAMMVYACDYLAVHQGERSGRFVCERPPVGRTSGRGIELEMPVWLAPFERNLSQQAVLAAAPADDASWWVLSLDLRQLSGPAYLWKRGATVFVDLLCKHLLRWRAATETQEADCLARAEQLFPAAGQ